MSELKSEGELISANGADAQQRASTLLSLERMATRATFAPDGSGWYSHADALLPDDYTRVNLTDFTASASVQNADLDSSNRKISW